MSDAILTNKNGFTIFKHDRYVIRFKAAIFFVKSNGDSVLKNRGVLSDREINRIQAFIKDHYMEMYMKWAEYSENGFYEHD